MPHTPHSEPVQGAEHHFMFALIPRFDFSKLCLLSDELILEDFDLRPEATPGPFRCCRLERPGKMGRF